MKVLIISHNVISETNNMGKTLLSYFRDFSPDELAEFYIQDKEPKNAAVCSSFYRVTDRDALKSVFGKKVGTSFHLTESRPETGVSGVGTVEAIRQYGRKRTGFIYTMRNAVWSLAHWRNRALVSWLRTFDPDVIFFMAGDYSFMFKITLAIRNMLQKPLVVCCVDDYFMFNRNENSALGRWQHKLFMNHVNRLMEKACMLLTISDSMTEAYHALFHKPCFTLHTSANRRAGARGEARRGIAYFGNLGYRRFEQLAEMGRAVKSLGLDGFGGIDVYSAEKNPDRLAGLTEENGVFFRGEIPPAEVGERMNQYAAIIHTESFDPKIQELVRYSVSTKIADSLLNGPCLIAYGPGGIASIDYLRANNAACCITKPEELAPRLRELLTNPALREELVRNARALAARNHDAAKTPGQVRAWLQEAIDRATEMRGSP